jgi:Rab-GTPase-TBC domain
MAAKRVQISYYACQIGQTVSSWSGAPARSRGCGSGRRLKALPAPAAPRFAKWRERRSRVDKDVRRTDRAHAFYAGDRNLHVKALRRILLTYSMYNFDLGYCQVRGRASGAAAR